MKKITILLTLLAITTFVFAANPQEETKKTTKPISMNKNMFIEKVFDYQNNPSEWKYKGDRPSIIDFWAPWCGPCVRLSPILDELAAEYGDEIYIYKINVDNEPELAAAFGVQSIPALLFIPMQGTPHSAQGAIPKASFKKVIDEVLLKKKNDR